MGLREIRFLKGLNQYDLSLKTGISQSRISLIENGYANPKKEEKKKIAKVLHTPVDKLFGDNGNGLNDKRRNQSA